MPTSTDSCRKGIDWLRSNFRSGYPVPLVWVPRCNLCLSDFPTSLVSLFGIPEVSTGDLVHGNLWFQPIVSQWGHRSNTSGTGAKLQQAATSEQSWYSLISPRGEWIETSLSLSKGTRNTARRSYPVGSTSKSVTLPMGEWIETSEDPFHIVETPEMYVYGVDVGNVYCKDPSGSVVLSPGFNSGRNTSDTSERPF